MAAARELVVMAVPAAHMREAAVRIASMVRTGHRRALGRQGHRARQPRAHERGPGAELPIDPGRVCALSGPNLAAEIARGLPASAVVGATDDAVGASRSWSCSGARTFRLYRNRDLVGVELAGALKNIVAIAAGAADALGLGDNGKAAIVTRGLAEITRLGVAAGANPLTFAGLAGIGDILATVRIAAVPQPPAGHGAGARRRWAEIEASLPGVAEGAYTVTAALALAERLGVELPIAREVHAVLYAGKPVQDSLADLLSRTRRTSWPVCLPAIDPGRAAPW